MIESFNQEILVLLKTNISSLNNATIFNALGFDIYELSEGDGYLGGIWIGWKSSRILVSVLKMNFQFIHTIIQEVNGRKWLFTLIYANPNNNMKKDLWRKLENLSYYTQ